MTTNFILFSLPELGEEEIQEVVDIKIDNEVIIRTEICTHF